MYIDPIDIDIDYKAYADGGTGRVFTGVWRGKSVAVKVGGGVTPTAPDWGVTPPPDPSP